MDSFLLFIEYFCDKDSYKARTVARFLDMDFCYGALDIMALKVRCDRIHKGNPLKEMG